MMRDKAVVMTLIMTILQHYDYALFGLSAAWLTSSFIPENDFMSPQNAFWVLFAGSVMIRPLGAVFFGSIGDIYGRSILLKITSWISVISTMGLGLLPSFDYLGMWAILGLLLLRMLFLLCLSGKSDGARIYLAEKVGTKSELIANGIMSFCGHLGTTFAAYMCYLVTYYEYSWRLNFIFGSVLGIIVLLFRHHLTETEEFSNPDSQIEGKENKLFAILKRYRPLVICAMITIGGVGGSFTLLVIYLHSFIASQGIGIAKDAYEILTFATFLYGLSAIVGGIVATYWNAKYFVIIVLATQLCSYLYQFILLLKYEFSINAHIMAIMALGMSSGIIQMTIKNFLHVRSRIRVFSISHALGSMCLSSTAPLFATQFITVTGSPAAYSFYLAILSSLIMTMYIRITRFTPPVM